MVGESVKQVEVGKQKAVNYRGEGKSITPLPRAGNSLVTFSLGVQVHAVVRFKMEPQ